MKVLYTKLIFVSLLTFGCAPSLGTPFPFDFTGYQDGPIPEEAARWLNGGAQSAITPRIAAEAREISGGNRRERLFRAMQHAWRTFSYDGWRNTDAFQRTADELFEGRVLGGCSDFALVEIALFRALGVPSRMVITANVDWIYEYSVDRLAMAEGHSFIEVFLEDRWYLVDSTYRWFFSDYDPGLPSFPHGEYFCRRGNDFWDMGIHSVRELEQRLVDLALNYEHDFEEPSYPKYPI